MTTSVRVSPGDLPDGAVAQLSEAIARIETSAGDLPSVLVTGPLLRAIEMIVREVSAGRCVDVVSVDAMLTTSEAAALLHVSRPTLVKLLDDGVLPCERPGVHRRVPRAAVDAYVAGSRRRRATALDVLAAEGDDGIDEFVTTR